MALHLHRTRSGLILSLDGKYFVGPDAEIDDVINRPEPLAEMTEFVRSADPLPAPDPHDLLAPVGSQEVWAAGVTYERSREGRREEAKESGAAVFYSRVYDAPRPELFFKAAGWRVIGPHGAIRIRSDAHWNVPEPELVLVLNRAGRIVGYTVGNDVSSRDIEGENPLYLPQAKVYDGSCALGPAILLSDSPPEGATEVTLTVERQGGGEAFRGSVALERIRRPFDQLAEYLFRELTFPAGAFLFTGTGIVPPNDFTLAGGDRVTIAIGEVGTLVNTVA